MSRPGPALLAAILAISWGSEAAAGQDLEAQVAELAWATAGRHEEVIARAARLLDAMPLDARPTAGRSTSARRPSRTSASDNATCISSGWPHPTRGVTGSPTWNPPRPRAARGQWGFDWLTSVTCVDGLTGRRLWSRRFIPTRLALDRARPCGPGTETWDVDPPRRPGLGDATARGVMPPVEEHRRPRGLRVDGLRLWGPATANTVDLPATMNSTSTGCGEASGLPSRPGVSQRLTCPEMDGLPVARGRDKAIQLVPPVAG
ncbi:MAG: hypothetical protein WKF75_02860 [Singulisphaera sp.]